MKELLQHEFFSEEVPFRVEIKDKVSALIGLPPSSDSLAPPLPGGMAGAGNCGLPDLKLSFTFLDGRFSANGTPEGTRAPNAAADKNLYEFTYNYAHDTPLGVAQEMLVRINYRTTYVQVYSIICLLLTSRSQSLVLG